MGSRIDLIHRQELVPRYAMVNKKQKGDPKWLWSKPLALLNQML